MVVAVFVMYVILAILYESYLHPITVLSSLPVALLGGLLTLWLFGAEASLYAYIGMFMLMGIVKKNGIMIVDFAEQRVRQGIADDQAIHDASMERFRPIMMTTMAALMGALPIALGYGADGSSRRPLGLVVVGGLIVSQFITLYVTPAIYLYLEEFQEKVLDRVPFLRSTANPHRRRVQTFALQEGMEINPMTQNLRIVLISLCCVFVALRADRLRSRAKLQATERRRSEHISRSDGRYSTAGDRSRPRQNAAGDDGNLLLNRLARKNGGRFFRTRELQESDSHRPQNNYDVRIAATRVLQAQAQVGITRADQLPSVGAGGKITSNRSPKVAQFRRMSSRREKFTASAAWNLDFWGKYRRATEAARAKLLANQWAKKKSWRLWSPTWPPLIFNSAQLDLELEISQAHARDARRVSPTDADSRSSTESTLYRTCGNRSNWYTPLPPKCPTWNARSLKRKTPSAYFSATIPATSLGG